MNKHLDTLFRNGTINQLIINIGCKDITFVCTILYHMKELNLHKIDFLVALIAEFGKRFGLSTKDAYRYINQYGGIQMFLNHYDILHTLSFRDMVDGMAAFCHRHGRQLV